MQTKCIINKNTFIAGLGGFQYGYNSSVIAGALVFLTGSFALTIFQEGIVASMLLFGALFTSSFAGVLGNHLGRRPTMMLSAAFFFLGILVSSLATHFWVLIAGRFIVGLGGGIITTIAPVYLAEISPPERRGSVVNLNQIGIAVGSLCGYISNAFIGNWRWMFAVGLIPALIQGIGLLFVSETHSASNNIALKGASWKSLFASGYRPRLYLGIALCVFQQITGINTIFFYAPFILQSAGYSTAAGALFSTVGIGIVYAVSIGLSFILVDRVGRRPLVLWSLGGMAANLLLLSFFFFTGSQYLGHTSLLILMLIVAFYSIGIGPIPQLLIAEISPVHIRGHAMTFTGFIGWVCNYLVTLTFPELALILSPGGIFLIYALCGVFAWQLLRLKVPETKHKSFEEIEKGFQ